MDIVVILNYSISIIMLNELLIKQILIIVCTSIIIWAIYNQNYIKILILLLLYQFDFLQNEQQENILITIACGLLIMNVMIFFLINDITKREMQIAEARLLNEKIKNETFEIRQRIR